VRPELDLRKIALPELTRLRDTTGETACLHVMFGDARKCVVQVESRDEIRWTAEVGRPFPLTGAPGKVFMAFLPDKERIRLLRAKKSVLNQAHWEREIFKIRRVGYALARNETIDGVSSVSAPVFDVYGNIIAAVTLLGRSKTLSPERLRKYANFVREAAGRISPAHTDP
jgi:IclR family acetate operon transcriptional repressor